MYWLFVDEIDSDMCTKGGEISQKNASDFDEKDTGTTKPEGLGNCLSVEK